MKEYYVTMDDTFMSGWGEAEGKTNKLIFKCKDKEEANVVAENAKRRAINAIFMYVLTYHIIVKINSMSSIKRLMIILNGIKKEPSDCRSAGTINKEV